MKISENQRIRGLSSEGSDLTYKRIDFGCRLSVARH